MAFMLKQFVDKKIHCHVLLPKLLNQVLIFIRQLSIEQIVQLSAGTQCLKITGLPVDIPCKRKSLKHFTNLFYGQLSTTPLTSSNETPREKGPS